MGFIPVITPVGFGEDGKALNVNADWAASKIAAALGISKILYLTDQDGILDSEGSLISEVDAAQIHDLIHTGVVKGGMLAKVQTILHALSMGVKNVHILNAKRPHCLIEELFTSQGVGTICTQEKAQAKVLKKSKKIKSKIISKKSNGVKMFQSTPEALKNILSKGFVGTQEELREKLEELGLSVNQSTISRALRKLGAIKTTNANGETVYKLNLFGNNNEPADILNPEKANLSKLIIDIQNNGSLIVMHTTPGSASLIASILDRKKPAKLLGTLAGDDTIFIAPAASDRISQTVTEIENLFSS